MSPASPHPTDHLAAVPGGSGASSPAPDTLRVAVLGGGLMGHAIAGIHARAGARVTLAEPDDATRRTIPDRVERTFSALGDTASLLERLTVVADLDEALAGSDLVIEAVPESLELKRDVVRRASRLAPTAVFATNTSAIRITEIASHHHQPESVVGTHYFNPPHLIPLVEVVPGERTAASTVEWVSDLLRSMGKVPAALASDAPGFIGNRIQHAMWREALALLDEGVADADTIDLVVRTSFGPRLSVMGPIENADYVGLDLVKNVHDYLFPHLSTRSTASPCVADAVARGNLGRRSGQGLTSWPDGRSDEVTERLSAHLMRHFDEQHSSRP